MATTTGVFDFSTGTAWTRVAALGDRPFAGVVTDGEVRLAIADDGAVWRSISAGPGKHGDWLPLTAK